jgi:hypothetical protein
MRGKFCGVMKYGDCRQFTSSVKQAEPQSGGTLVVNHKLV